MTALARKEPGAAQSAVVRPAPRLAPADLASEAVDSPARRLQLALELAYDAPEPHVEKWPAAYRLLVLGLAALAPWAAIVAGARALLR